MPSTRRAKHLHAVESVIEPIEPNTVEGVAYDGSFKSFTDQYSDRPTTEGEVITISELDLKTAWADHGLNTDSYLYFVLKFEGDDSKLDPQDVADRWSAENAQGKLKELKADQAEKAMLKLRKQGAIEYRQTVIDFRMNY